MKVIDEEKQVPCALNDLELLQQALPVQLEPRNLSWWLSVSGPSGALNLVSSCSPEQQCLLQLSQRHHLISFYLLIPLIPLGLLPFRQHALPEGCLAWPGPLDLGQARFKSPPQPHVVNLVHLSVIDTIRRVRSVADAFNSHCPVAASETMTMTTMQCTRSNSYQMYCCMNGLLATPSMPPFPIPTKNPGTEA